VVGRAEDQVEWDKAYRIALRVLRSESLAKDAAQDTMLRVHETRGRYDVRDRNAWFQRVAYTCALRYVTSAWARRRVRGGLDEESLPSPGPTPEIDASAALLSACLEGCLDGLNDDERVVFEERYLRGATDKEIAAIFKIQPNAAKQRAFRARQRVRDCVVHAGCASSNPAPTLQEDGALLNAVCVPCDRGGPAVKGAALAALMSLLRRASKGGAGWRLVGESSVERVYSFPDFARALEFTNRIGWLAEAEGHHPEIELSFGRVLVRTYTMKSGGLTKSDFVLAAKVDHVWDLMAVQA